MTTDKESSYLKEVAGKHEITPIARQAADLTEGVLSCNAAVIYKNEKMSCTFSKK